MRKTDKVSEVGQTSDQGLLVGVSSRYVGDAEPGLALKGDMDLARLAASEYGEEQMLRAASDGGKFLDK